MLGEQILGGVLLAIVSPVIVSGMVWVFLEDYSNPIFRGERYGLNGKVFHQHKIRSMYASNSKNSSDVTKGTDNRITKAGRVIRRLKIDELAQLLNIAKGEMSFFGPRPETPSIVDKQYSSYDKITLKVRPGLLSTGTLFYWLYLEEEIESDEYYKSVCLPLKLRIEVASIKKGLDSADMIWLVIITMVGICNKRLARVAFDKRFSWSLEMARISGLVI